MIDDPNGQLTEFRILAVLILAALGGLWILASDDWRAALEYALGAGAILLAFAALAVGQVALDRVGWGLFSLFWLVGLGSGVVLWSVGLPWQVAVPGGVLVGFGTAVGAAALVRDRRLRTLERPLRCSSGCGGPRRGSGRSSGRVGMDCRSGSGPGWTGGWKRRADGPVLALGGRVRARHGSMRAGRRPPLERNR